MSDVDYPAAHSMDTDWFAVDADGHVALMVSGEPGPLPEGLEHERSGSDVLKALAIGNPSALLGKHCGNESMRLDVVLVVPSTAGLEAIRAAARTGFELGPEYSDNERSLRVINVTRMSAELFERLHARGLCLGCASAYDETELAPLLGIYIYDASDQYQWGPYERGPLPPDPKFLNEIPNAIRESLVPVAFSELHFSEAPAIQPLEHLPCNTWGGGEGHQYLASDLKTLRPFPSSDQSDEAT